MILRHVRLDELLRRERDGCVSFYVALRVDGVPLTLLLTPADYAEAERLHRSGVPLVLTIAEESAT